MAEHRDLTPQVRELTKNGVDPVVRRTVFLWIVALGVTATLIWTALLMRGESANAVPGTPTIRPQVMTVTYNEQGWPIMVDELGVAVHPEDMGQ